MHKRYSLALMKRTVIAFAAFFGAAFVSAAQLTEQQLFGVKIGEALPSQFKGKGTNVGAFTFLPIPTHHPSLQTELQTLNLFSDSSTAVVIGVRGDRPFNIRADCEASSKRIDAILNLTYPVPYQGKDRKYQRQSTNGEILADIRCVDQPPFVNLSLEVTNPNLEEPLMKKWRNER